MNFAIFVTLLLVLLIIGLGFLIWSGSLPVITPQNSAYQAQLNQAIAQKSGFGSPNPISCPALPNGSADPFCRGNCLFYETFSQETAIVNNISPITNSATNLPAQFSCLDGFIQALSLQTAVCQEDTCTGQDGNTYLNGQSEQFYAPCGSLPNCTQSFRNAIVLNFQLNSVGQPNIAGAQCIAATETTIDSIQFIPSICPNSVSLLSDTFLNVIPGPIVIAPGLTGYQIQAPGTDICLQVNQDQLITASCFEFASQGFNWYLFPGLTIPGLLGGNAWNYPQQFINVDAIFVNEIPTLTGLGTTLESQEQLYLNSLKGITGSGLTFVNDILGGVNTAILAGNCSDLTTQIEAAEKAIQNDRISHLVTAVSNGLNLAKTIQQIYNLLGTTNSSCISAITALQVNTNQNALILGPIGGCPVTSSSGNPILCQYNTQLISGQAWNCTA